MQYSTSVRERLKINLFLCLSKHHAMKTYGRVEVQVHAFLTWAIDGEGPASRPSRLTLEKYKRYRILYLYMYISHMNS
jgi:hypothetical protein